MSNKIYDINHNIINVGDRVLWTFIHGRVKCINPDTKTVTFDEDVTNKSFEVPASELKRLEEE